LFKEIESEEDFGEALRQVPEVWDDSDFLAAQRDAIEYLNKSEDEKAKTKPPRLIINLQRHIAERRWLALLKLAKEYSESGDDDSLHGSSILSEWMPEVVDKMLELNPDIKERADFDRWYREYRSWVMIMSARVSGEIPDVPSPEQLKELSTRFKVVVGTLRRWIKEETAPYLISMLRRRMESDISVRTPMLLPGLPESYAEFLKVLRKHPDLKKSKDFLQRRKRVKLYYGFFDFALENIGMPLQALARAYGQKHGFSAGVVSDWGRGKRIPILLRQVVERETGVATPRPTKVTDAHKIRSLSEYRRILLRHPYLLDLIDFKERNSTVLAHFAALDLKKRYPEMSYREIARRVGQPAGTVTNWFHKETQTPFLLQLANNERKRREYEDALSKNARKNLIPSEQLYQSLKRFRRRDNLTVRKVANSLLKLAQDLTQPISFAKLRSYNHESPRWLSELAKFILENREDIERRMRLRSKNGLRLGIVENTLFIRKVKDDPLDYFQMLGSELFFFDKAFKETLIRNAMMALGGVGQFNLSKLVRQMTDVGPIEEIPKSGTNSDLRFEEDFLIGDTLRFILDALDESVMEIEKQIVAVGSRKQISEPKILSKREFLILAARLFAIIASDGHIADDFQTFYSERNAHRRTIVRRWLATLGEIKTPDKVEKGEIIGFSLPAVLGRLLNSLGIPTGDKTLKGIRLPSFILDGPLEVQRAYLEEVIPEDGWIKIGRSGDKVEVGIGRAVILFDPKKRTKNPLTSQQANFVKRFGTPRKVVRGDYRHLGISKLRRLSRRRDKRIAHMAQEIIELILSTPPALLMDEKKLMKMNGIAAKEYFEGVRFSEATERVSASWTVRSGKKLDVALLGLSASPNDKKKRSKLSRWMKKNPELVRKAKILLDKR
jgi:AcrR family transcriptional regulator